VTERRVRVFWGNGKEAMSKPESFLVVVDDDRKQFTVEGPLTDERPWNVAITAAQQEGRKVKSVNLGSSSRAEAMRVWQEHYGHFYQFVPPGRIISPS
jgi:hypothetical protein